MKKIVLTFRNEQLSEAMTSLGAAIGLAASFHMEDLPEEPPARKSKGPLTGDALAATVSNSRTCAALRTLRHADRAEFSYEDAGVVMREAGFSAGSISPTISIMTRMGEIEKFAKDRYRFTS